MGRKVKYGEVSTVFIRMLTASVITMLIFSFFLIGYVSGQQPAIDLYTQESGQGSNQPSNAFAPGDQVTLYAYVTLSTAPVQDKLVALEINDPDNITVLDRTGVTNASGIAEINFTLPITCIPGRTIIGEWTAISTVSVAEITVNDTLTFRVTGATIDVYTQKDGKGPSTPSDAFAPQEEVILYAHVTYDCHPIEDKLVAFEVRDANGTYVTYKTDLTNASGLATASFRIGSMPSFGIWNVTATVEVLQKTVSDKLTFRVGWIVKIVNVETVNEEGEKEINFVRGKHLSFNITVQNIAFTSKTVVFTVVAYDEQGVPIGQVVLLGWIVPSGTSQVFIFDLQLPKWASVGAGSIYTNAYTNLPQAGGFPWCPEASTFFKINLSI